MRPALIASFVLAGVIAAPLARTSEACMCLPVTLSNHFSASSDVVAGRIVGVSQIEHDVLIRVRVEHVYRGAATVGAVMAIWLYDGFLGEHQTPGRVGQRWMMFATPYASVRGRRVPHRRHASSLMTGTCSGNWRITAKRPAPATLTIDLPPPPSLSLFLPLPSPPPPPPPPPSRP